LPGVTCGIGAVSLVCLALTAFPSLVAWAVGTWTRVFGPVAVLAAPLGWVAVELMRARTGLNFPWCLLGYRQHANLPMIQVARVTAVYGVSLLVAGVSSVLAYLALESRPRPRRVAVIAATLLVAVVWLDGVLRLRRAEPPAPTLRVGRGEGAILPGG